MIRNGVIRRFKVPFELYRESELNMTQDTQQLNCEEDLEEMSHLDMLDMTQVAINSGRSDDGDNAQTLENMLQRQQDDINRSAREYEETKVKVMAMKTKLDKYKQIREAKLKELRELLANLKKTSPTNAVDKKKLIQTK